MTALTDFQAKIGVTPDGVFGAGTLQAATKFFKLPKPAAAHFFAQCAHESGGFKVTTENLNYSADGLCRVFSKYFDPSSASVCARNPEQIANKVYANRMGNGPESSGDGWKYRGRGMIQLTGKNNYTAFAKSGYPEILSNPDLLSDKFAFESAKWFFDYNNIWTFTDRVDDSTIASVTKKVNGGFNGLEERKVLTKKFYSWLV